MKIGFRKKLLIILGIVFAIGTQVILITYSGKDEILCQVFARSNSLCQNGKFVMDVSLESKYITEKDTEELLAYIAATAGLSKGEYEYKDIEDGVSLMGKNEKVEATITIRKLDDGDIRILVNVQSDFEEYIGAKGQIFDVKNNLKEFFDEEEMKVLKEYIVLKGKYPGKVSNEFLEYNTKEICNRMEAVIVYEKMDQGMYLVYAYSDQIRENVDVLGAKSNVNVVYTYDGEDDITDMYIATPILNDEY